MNVQQVVDAIKRVLPAKRPIEHHAPKYGHKESLYLSDCLVRGVTTYHYVKRFEDKLKEICGVDNVIATSSGTAALHIALLAAGVAPGEEVLVPDLTFVGTANAVCHAGAIPHFIDCPLNLQAFKLRQYLGHATVAAPDKRGRINKETGRRITTIIVVHLLGFPAPIESITEVARAYGLQVIEDAAEALGSKIGKAKCGSFGVVSILSFNNNKIVTTNGGGALLTNDPWIAAKASQLATTARVDHPWKVEHDAVAWNYRLPNLNAAFGLAQLEQLDEFLAKKHTLARTYLRELSDIGGIKLVGIDAWGDGEPNYWLTTIELQPGHEGKRDELLEALHSEGIKARAIFTPLHKLPMYKDHPRSNNTMVMSEGAEKRMICLPSGPGLVA